MLKEQQIREQYGAPMRLLREPTQNTIAIRVDFFAVRGPPRMSPWVGPRGLRIHLSSGRGDNVGVAAVAVLLEVRRIERLEARGNHHRARQSL